MKIEREQGDCLELMKDIPDGSVDMILADLPYGTIKGAKLDSWVNQTTEWDEVIDTGRLFLEYERVLRMNGVAILFSQEPYTSHLRTFKSENFIFLYPMIWKKDHFANALISKKAPVSYFEDINVFAKKYDKQNLHPLRGYFKKILEFVGIEPSKINSVLGHRRAEHCFYIESSQFGLCTENTYQELIYKFEINKMNGFKVNIETKIKEEAIYWIDCEKEGFKENQKVEFENWIKEELHQKIYNRMKLVHQMAKSLSKENKENLSDNVHFEIRKERFSKKIRYFSSAAAVLFILCFSAFKIYDNNFAVQYSKTFQTDKTNLANQQLPDGSTIFIDAKPSVS